MFYTFTFLIIINSFIGIIFCQSIDPDEDRDVVQIIESRNFKAEVHTVTTEDGYILIIHRIVNPLLNQTIKPIILHHGVMASSADFIVNSDGDYLNINQTNQTVGNNLGFVLSNLGYDVWLPNSRGNNYSINHIKYNPHKDPEYWKFSFDEMIEYDLPTTIKYILKTTNKTSLGYVGHSQGTLILFGLLASKPEFTNYIKPFIAMAPVARVTHIRSPIRYLAHNSFLMGYFRRYGGPFLPPNRVVQYLADAICDSRSKTICSNILFLLCGFDDHQLNYSRLGVYFKHTPDGTSSWDMVHYGQMILSAKFQKFDFGKHENLIRYGTDSPPEYPIENINSKYIALIYGKNDWLVNYKDLNWLKANLKEPLLYDHEVPYEHWNHLDFIWAKDTGKYVNSKIVDILSKLDSEHLN